jgi:redox-sensitive bicupin YhaK (pirin superfamily)
MAEQGATLRRIVRKLRGQPATDGAGVRMTRVIGTDRLDHLDPFLLLDEFRSDNPDDYIAGFPDHPHRGFETVTYMLAGSMEHGDNQGNSGLLGPGSVQWMTAGRGIVHSELPRQEDGLMWGFQLWVNLPARDKMTSPRYQDIPADEVPVVEPDARSRVKVLAGCFDGVEGPVRGVTTEPLYLDVGLSPGGEAGIALPAAHTAFVYCFDGSVLVSAGTDEPLGRGELAILSGGDRLVLRADSVARCLVVAGRPLGEPVARYGPFVMNTADELRQAFVDFQAGRF